MKLYEVYINNNEDPYGGEEHITVIMVAESEEEVIKKVRVNFKEIEKDTCFSGCVEKCTIIATEISEIEGYKITLTKIGE